MVVHVLEGFEERQEGGAVSQGHLQEREHSSVEVFLRDVLEVGQSSALVRLGSALAHLGEEGHFALELQAVDQRNLPVQARPHRCL